MDHEEIKRQAGKRAAIEGRDKPSALDLQKQIEKTLTVHILRAKVLKGADTKQAWDLLKENKLSPPEICARLAEELHNLLKERHDVPIKDSKRHDGLGLSDELIRARCSRLFDTLLKQAIELF